MLKRTPLARRTRLVARKALQAKTPLKRSAVRLARAPLVQKRQRPVADQVYDAVLERDSYSCVLCGVGIGPEGRGVGWSLHHRVRRSQGGKHTVENLITLCGSGCTGCHGAVHADPVKGRAGGWLLRRGQNPALCPVLVVAIRWVLLTPDGRYDLVRLEAVDG